MPSATVLYFAVLRERRGRDSETITVDPGTTLRQLYEGLFPPGPEGILPVGFARNREHASGSDLVQEGDEIALLPPLGGG